MKAQKNNNRGSINRSSIKFMVIFGVIVIILIVSTISAINLMSSIRKKINAEIESKQQESVEETTAVDIIEDKERVYINIDRDGNFIIKDEKETEPEVTDHTKEITSTQYTLSEGVRARLLPSEDGEIFKVIYDIYTPIGVISEGSEWYKCCIDNTICYINWRYIGDEEDVAYVKEKRAKQEELEARRKASAYYEVFENMTSEDKDLLIRILALEAGDQSFEGRCAVVEVILNRCISKNPSWPNTIGEVLMQKGQFSTVRYLSHPYCKPSDMDYDAINYVRDNGPTVIRSMLDKEGRDDINSLDYVYFATYHANGSGPVIHLGDHYFARESNKAYWRSR